MQRSNESDFGSMVIDVPAHLPQPAQSLFCSSASARTGGATERPAISMAVRERFAANFAAAFAAAMTEHCHEDGVKA